VKISPAGSGIGSGVASGDIVQPVTCKIFARIMLFCIDFFIEGLTLKTVSNVAKVRSTKKLLPLGKIFVFYIAIHDTERYRILTKRFYLEDHCYFQTSIVG
jgi:hypothetical protein